MDADIDNFLKSCLLCKVTDGGEVMPVPWAPTLHATRPGEATHFDFLYMGPSTTGENYTLILKDDAGKYVWLRPTKSADAATTAESLSDWSAAFGVSHVWISDQGPHFVNEVTRQLTAALKVNHRFSPAY